MGGKNFPRMEFKKSKIAIITQFLCRSSGTISEKINKQI